MIMDPEDNSTTILVQVSGDGLMSTFRLGPFTLEFWAG